MICEKCKFPDGLKVKPDGENELDPCIYETAQVFTNCIVEVCRCKKCGRVSVSWRITEDTMEVPKSDWSMFV